MGERIDFARMFASLVWPFKITLVLLGIGFVWAVATAKKSSQAYLRILCLLLAFIPSCTGISLLMDQFRYGRFRHENMQSLAGDKYVILPAGATHIELFKHSMGHLAQFSITTPELLDWIKAQRAIRPDLNAPSRQESEKPGNFEPSTFVETFKPLGASCDSAMIEYAISLSDRGGSYRVWHSPGSGVAFLRAYYW